jgi:hypothetical protein
MRSVLLFLGILSFLSGMMPFYALGKEPLGDSLLKPGGDSLLPVAVRENIRDEALLNDLAEVETDYDKTGNDRKALVRLLRMVKFRKAGRELRSGRGLVTDRAGGRLMNDLADVLVKLKMYPLAMRCYYKAARDSDLYARLGEMDTTGFPERPGGEIKSPPIPGPAIWGAFDDGKTALSYALLVEVKQPVPGKRKSFTRINNVGHTFVTLIKYNTDNSYVSRSFGFYPHKATIFSGTPIHPGSPSVFKNDTLHDWDEVVGKFISVRKFERIIEIVKRYNLSIYNLNRNNCTSFGLSVALAGGILIRDTQGTWPLGKGDNPGNAGQSILEGKVSDMDAEDKEPLFVRGYTGLVGYR